MLNFTFNSLGEAWIYTLKTIMHSGEIICDNDNLLKEIYGLTLTLNDVSIDSIIQQYADKDRIELMQKKYSTCGLVGGYKIDYGSYLFNNNGINQIEWIITKLRTNRETKSATIGLHKPGENQLSCLSLLDFKIRNEQLKMGVVYRSQNAYASHPGNMLALRRIQKDVANKLDLAVGPVKLVVFSSHVYKHDFSAVNKILSEVNSFEV